MSSSSGDHEDYDALVREMVVGIRDLRVKLEQIEAHMSQIEKKLDGIQQSASNMDSHIDLVDGVYRQVKTPFFAVMDYAGSYLAPRAIEQEEDMP